MTCVKCGSEIADDRVRVAIMLGDGRAALDWQCFEAMLKPGRAAELMRLVRAAAISSRLDGAGAASARRENYQGEPE
jgi:hypothetical protein